MHNSNKGKNHSDVELIKKFKSGDSVAFNTLFTKYQFHVKKLSRDFFNANKMEYLTLDDIYSVCLEAFFYGAKSFNPDNNNNFYCYFRKIVEHELVKFMQENNSFYMNIAFSLDEQICFDNNVTKGEMFCKSEDHIVDIDRDNLIMQICEDDSINLNEEQKVAISLRMFGETFITIGEKLGCDVNRARAIFHRGIAKIRKHKIQFRQFK